MRDGGHVFDRGNRKAGLLYGTYSGFASLTGATNFYGYFAHTQSNGFFSGFVAGDLSSKRSALFGAFKTVRTGGGPSNGVAFVIADGYDGVIERTINVHHAERRGFGVFLFAFCRRSSRGGFNFFFFCPMLNPKI